MSCDKGDRRAANQLPGESVPSCTTLPSGCEGQGKHPLCPAWRRMPNGWQNRICFHTRLLSPSSAVPSVVLSATAGQNFSARPKESEFQCRGSALRMEGLIAEDERNGDAEGSSGVERA